MSSAGAAFKKNMAIIGISFGTVISALAGFFIYKKYLKKSNIRPAQIPQNTFVAQLQNTASISEEKKQVFIASFKELKYELTPLIYTQSIAIQKVLQKNPDIDKGQLKEMFFSNPEYLQERGRILDKILVKYKITLQDWVKLEHNLKSDSEFIKYYKEAEKLVDDAAGGKFSYEIIIPESMTEKKFWLLAELRSIPPTALTLELRGILTEKGYTERDLVSPFVNNELLKIKRKYDARPKEIETLNTDLYPGDLVISSYANRLILENPDAAALKVNEIEMNLSSIVHAVEKAALGWKEGLQILEKRQAEIQADLANLEQ